MICCFQIRFSKTNFNRKLECLTKWPTKYQCPGPYSGQ